MDKKCANCKNWNIQNGSKGICRAKAPFPTILSGTDKGKFVLVWPLTEDKEWCGEFVEETIA